MSSNDRKTTFLARIKEKRPDLTVLGEYKGSNQKILVRGNSCGHEWNTTPNNMRIGIGCPHCFNKRLSEKLTYTNDEFLVRIKEINPNYDIVGSYSKSVDYATFKCNIHNNTWKMRAGHLKNDSCKMCKIDQKKKKIHSVIQKENPTLIILSEYVDCHTKISVKCSIDDNVFYAKPLALKNGNVECDACKKRDLDKETVKEVFRLEPNIEFIDEFMGMDDPIFYRIKGNPTTFEDTPSNILRMLKNKKFKS